MSDDGLGRADRPPPRHSAVLVVATVAATVLGGWWWVSNAPPAADGRAWGAPPAGLQPLVAAEIVPVAPVAPAEPTSPAEPTAPAEAGRADPPVPVPVELIDSDLAELEALLPETDALIRRQLGVLTANDVMDYTGTVPADGSYLLEVVCQGDGEFEASVIMPGGSESVRTIACDGTVESIELSSTSIGSALIRLEARTASLVVAASQLVGR